MQGGLCGWHDPLLQLLLGHGRCQGLTAGHCMTGVVRTLGRGWLIHPVTHCSQKLVHGRASVVQCISHSTNLSLSSRVFQALRWVFSYISEQHEDLYLKEIVVWKGLLPVTCRHWMNRSLSSERSLEAQDQAPRLSWPSSRRSGWSVTM